MHLFSGTGVALVTPFNTNGALDFEALNRLVDKVITEGVDYIVALGTTGETPTLSGGEKSQVLRAIVARTAGRVPVVCGAGGNNTTEVVDWIANEDLSGVAGLLSVVPYYNKPTQEGIYRHFSAIASSTTLPIILYNVPGRTVTSMAPETTLRLAREFAHIVAVKEASASLPACMDLVAGAPAHFAVLSGDDDLVLPQMAIGMHGVISVAANCYTADFCELIKTARAGQMERARELNNQLVPKIRLLFAEGNPAGVKAVLHQMGYCELRVRLPLVEASVGLQEALAG